MFETSTSAEGRTARLPLGAGRVFAWLPVVVLAPVVLAQLLFFGMRAAHLLGYPFPLDYGEGPLLSQVQVLRGGTPIWVLYGDPGAPPYAVVNYPPVYHLAALALSYVTGGGAETASTGTTGAGTAPLLRAGRLVSLLATLGCAAALWALTRRQKAKGKRQNKPGHDQGSTAALIPQSVQPSAFSLRALVVLAFLGIPIVREWAAMMRVDMLGVCLGLWGLALVRRAAEGRMAVVWPALLLALSLFVKPSLLAAPAAALLWLLFRDWRLALRLGAALGVMGGGAFLLLQLASGGWFVSHVVAANANPIDRALGASFWDGQLDILWPLFAAGALGAVLQIADCRLQITRDAESRPAASGDLLPVYYTLFGALVALGVGKVGAYLNYFLELYAGLVWLAAAGLTVDRGPWTVPRLRSSVFGLRSSVISLTVAIPLLVAGSLLRYYPLWSETYLKPYGLIEGQSPPRVAFGSYGVWQDLAREAEVLGALGRVNAALAQEVRAAGAPIFTDLPGIAAQAGQLALHQAFEHRQLYDAGLWDQRPLLRDMANGRVPLVALDYLGNWLTPEMIALITHRYAQDGSRGPYDLYRPVDPGMLTPASLEFPGGLMVTGVRLAPPGADAYSGGELLTVTLEWAQGDQRPKTEDQAAPSPPAAPPAALQVVLQLLGKDKAVLAESFRPLLYGALPPHEWGDEAVQHMQPLALPVAIPPGEYTLAVTLRAGDVDLAPAQPVARVQVGELTGRVLGEGGYFVPASLLEAWARAGGYDGPGDPITPAVPFEGFTAQCFQRACYRLAGGQVERVPLEELISLGQTEPRDLRTAHLGEEYLRLPGGIPYRWP
jgi:hypothetical protein